MRRRFLFLALLILAAVVLVLASILVIVPWLNTSVARPTADGGDANPLCYTSCAPMISGWLHTALGSTHVYDSAGNAIPLMGVNVDGLDYGVGNPGTSPDSCDKGWSIPTSSFANVATWGFNFVRLPITWENLVPTAPTKAPNGTWVYNWNSAYLEELDYVVAQFGAHHVPVLFDFAQLDLSAAFEQAPEQEYGGECEGWGNPNWLYPNITSPSTLNEIAAGLCAFFNDRSLVGDSAPAPIDALEAAEQMLAARYENNQNVIGIDMFNEPWFNSKCGTIQEEGTLLTDFYTEIGDAVSEVNPHLLLVFNEPPPELMKDSPIMTAPPSIPNAVYEFHLYTSNWSSAEPYAEDYLANAQSWGMPAYLGEFDDFEAGSSGINAVLDPNWQADSRSLIQYCNQNDIEWSYWSYYSLGTNLQTQAPHSEILSLLRGELPFSPDPLLTYFYVGLAVAAAVTVVVVCYLYLRRRKRQKRRSMRDFH